MRRALTILEAIIVMAILGLLVAMLLPAIQKIRVSALRSQSCNNLRQIGLSFHMLANDSEGKVRDLPDHRHLNYYIRTESIFSKMLPYLGVDRRLRSDKKPSETEVMDFSHPILTFYYSSADPTINLDFGVYESTRHSDKISYFANMYAMDKTLMFPLHIHDGTSSTIFIAEKYFLNRFNYHGTDLPCWLNWKYIEPPDDGKGNFTSAPRRATFADKSAHDDLPVPDGTGYSIRKEQRPFGPPPNGKAFDLMPLYTDTWCNRLQTPHPAGLPVGLFDGSVRTLNPNIDERIFWSMVTPNGGKVVGEF